MGVRSVSHIELVLGVVVLAWVVIRQLQARRLKRWPVLGIFLAGLGVVAAVALLSKHALTSSVVVAVSLSLLVGATLAVARAFTVRLWSDPSGTVMRQGNWLTAVLWLAAVVLHVGLDRLDGSGVGTATIQFYFGVMLIVQTLVLNARSRTVRPSPRLPAGPSLERHPS